VPAKPGLMLRLMTMTVWGFIDVEDGHAEDWAGLIIAGAAGLVTSFGADNQGYVGLGKSRDFVHFD